MDSKFNVITHDPVLKTFLLTFTQWHIGWQIVYWGGGAGVEIAWCSGTAMGLEPGVPGFNLLSG